MTSIPPPAELLSPPSWGTCDIYLVKVLDQPEADNLELRIYCVCLTESEAKRVQLRLNAAGVTTTIDTATALYVEAFIPTSR